MTRKHTPIEAQREDKRAGRPADGTSGRAPRVPEDWIADFEAAARRPLATHLKYSFVRIYRPVLDDEPYRSFETMEEYRRWCETALPEWLGYGRAAPGSSGEVT